MADILLYAKGDENEEMRYAIRSWCENLSFGKLYVVGGPFPSWFKPDVYIKNLPALPTMAQCYTSLVKGLSNESLSDEVVIMMDDIFVVNYVGEWKTNYDRGTLDHQFETAQIRGPYTDLVRNTNLFLKKEIDSPLSYESHSPFVCNKADLLKTLTSLGTQRASSLLWRSIYGNRYNSPHVYRPDIKLKGNNPKIPPSADVISTNSGSWKNGIERVMEEWFPYKSKYEM